MILANQKAAAKIESTKLLIMYVPLKQIKQLSVIYLSNYSVCRSFCVACANSKSHGSPPYYSPFPLCRGHTQVTLAGLFLAHSPFTGHVLVINILQAAEMAHFPTRSRFQRHRRIALYRELGLHEDAMLLSTKLMGGRQGQCRRKVEQEIWRKQNLSLSHTHTLMINGKVCEAGEAGGAGGARSGGSTGETRLRLKCKLNGMAQIVYRTHKALYITSNYPAPRAIIPNMFYPSYKIIY